MALLGDTFQLNLQTVDAQRATPVGRATRLYRNLGLLRAQLPWAVAEASGAPLPPPPSRVLPYSLMAAGGLSLVGGGVLGILAFNQEGAIERELRNGVERPSALRTMDSYREEFSSIGVQRTVAMVALGAGVGLLTVGYLLNPTDPLEGARVSAVAVLPSVIPGGGGLAVAGAF